MNTWAEPGVKCVCISDNWGWATCGGYSLPTRTPMLNEILTVKAVNVFDGVVNLIFWEIEVNQRDGNLSADIWWVASSFRPLENRPTDISIFKGLLNDSTKKKVLID